MKDPAWISVDDLAMKDRATAKRYGELPVARLKMKEKMSESETADRSAFAAFMGVVFIFPRNMSTTRVMHPNCNLLRHKYQASRGKNDPKRNI